MFKLISTEEIEFNAYSFIVHGTSARYIFMNYLAWAVKHIPLVLFDYDFILILITIMIVERRDNSLIMLYLMS